MLSLPSCPGVQSFSQQMQAYKQLPACVLCVTLQLPAPTYKVPSLVSLPGRTESGLTAGLVAAKEWLHSRIAYQLQQLASANVSTKVLALWLLSTPFIVLAAMWYQKAAQVSFKEAMYKVSSGHWLCVCWWRVLASKALAFSRPPEAVGVPQSWSPLCHLCLVAGCFYPSSTAMTPGSTGSSPASLHPSRLH